MLICSALTLFLLFLGTNAATTASGCKKESNYWNCKIGNIYDTKVSVVERSGKITVQSVFSKQLLNSQTLASPGPGRSSTTWSSDGLSTLLVSNTKSIENIHDLYGIEKQKASLKSQCGGVSDLSWFDPKKKEAFFVRGHYGANADYQSDDYKKATFHYFNAAPQWQRFNNGNWKNKVEGPIQRLIKATTTSHVIYSGSYGQLTCPNAATTHVFIKNEIQNAAKTQIEIPIPKVFFKVIAPHNMQRPQKPIFIATINDPMMNKGQIEQYLGEHFCKADKDICDKIPDRSNTEYSWFRQSDFLCEKASTGNSRSIVEAGYTYACEATSAILSKFGISLEYKSTVEVSVPQAKQRRVGS